MQRFRGGLVFKAHRRVYHSTLGLRVIKKKKKKADLVLAPSKPATETPRNIEIMGMSLSDDYMYRGTSLIRSSHPPRATIGP